MTLHHDWFDNFPSYIKIHPVGCAVKQLGQKYLMVRHVLWNLGLEMYLSVNMFGLLTSINIYVTGPIRTTQFHILVSALAAKSTNTALLQSLHFKKDFHWL